MTNEEKQLKHAIKALPEHSAPENAWKNIERHLDKEAPLKRAIKSLPLYSASADNWGKIESQLKGDRTSLNYLTKMAAVLAIALLSGLGFYLSQSHKGEIQVRHYTIHPKTNTSTITNQGELEEINNYLEDLCQTNAQLCQTHNYQVLEKQLSEIRKARDEANKMLNRFPNDPQLKAKKAELVHKQINITKEMLQIASR